MRLFNKKDLILLFVTILKQICSRKIKINGKIIIEYHRIARQAAKKITAKPHPSGAGKEREVKND